MILLDKSNIRVTINFTINYSHTKVSLTLYSGTSTIIKTLY